MKCSTGHSNPPWTHSEHPANTRDSRTLGPLSGLRVVEIAGLGPAPCAGMMLADMGAEVIVIERRHPNPNAARQPDRERQQIFRRGKRSIALDLSNPDAADVVLSIVEDADVLIEGFRPGVAERLGIGPDVCMRRNPRLVYGRMTGWGQTGPLAHAAGHDPNYLAITGALWCGGTAERPPTAPITLVGDLGGGTMVLLLGILSAVVHASSSGEGQVVDCAITDGAAYISTLLWTMYGAGQIGDDLGRGWPNFAAPWHDTYACADGTYVTVCSLEPKFYAELIGRLGLSDDPVFADQWDELQWPEGKRRLREMFRTKTREQWCELLEGTDACFAPVLDLSEAPHHPHNVARGTFLDIDGVIQPAPAPRFSRTQPWAGVPPRPGEHNDQILKEVGLSDEAIERLKASGVV